MLKRFQKPNADHAVALQVMWHALPALALLLALVAAVILLRGYFFEHPPHLVSGEMKFSSLWGGIALPTPDDSGSLSIVREDLVVEGHVRGWIEVASRSAPLTLRLPQTAQSIRLLDVSNQASNEVARLHPVDFQEAATLSPSGSIYLTSTRVLSYRVATDRDYFTLGYGTNLMMETDSPVGISGFLPRDRLMTIPCFPGSIQLEAYGWSAGKPAVFPIRDADFIVLGKDSRIPLPEKAAIEITFAADAKDSAGDPFQAIGMPFRHQVELSSNQAGIYILRTGEIEQRAWFYSVEVGDPRGTLRAGTESYELGEGDLVLDLGAAFNPLSSPSPRKRRAEVIATIVGEGVEPPSLRISGAAKQIELNKEHLLKTRWASLSGDERAAFIAFLLSVVIWVLTLVKKQAPAYWHYLTAPLRPPPAEPPEGAFIIHTLSGEVVAGRLITKRGLFRREWVLADTWRKDTRGSWITDLPNRTIREAAIVEYYVIGELESPN